MKAYYVLLTTKTVPIQSSKSKHKLGSQYIRATTYYGKQRQHAQQCKIKYKLGEGGLAEIDASE